jgi:hypothetical protein
MVDVLLCLVIRGRHREAVYVLWLLGDVLVYVVSEWPAEDYWTSRWILCFVVSSILKMHIVCID